MHIELQNYLTKKFPKLYTEVGAEYPFSHYYFECEDGWFRLILWLSRYLQNYIDMQNEFAKRNPEKYLPVTQIKVLQVKEKFGTLAFYTHEGNQHTQAVIQFACFMSGNMCEFTGQLSDVGFNKKGWVKTHNRALCKNENDFHFVEDEELREILSKLKL